MGKWSEPGVFPVTKVMPYWEYPSSIRCVRWPGTRVRICYSFLNYRPLLGLEFYNRYNVSYNFTFADQLTPWEPTASSGEFIQRRDRSGRWFSKAMNPYSESDFVNVTRGTFVTSGNAPVWEMVLGHYKSRLNLAQSQYKWTVRCDSISRKNYGYEPAGISGRSSGISED